MPDFKSHSYLSGDGVILKLEQRFTLLLEGRLYCLSVINVTSGLAAILSCLPKGRVVTPMFTSPATDAAIKHAGHNITFCDIDPVTLCLLPQAVQCELDSDVRAIVAVNIFGHQSHLQALRQLADDLEALLVLDAAQSLATSLSNPELTSLADAVVFSLGPNKWIGCADGGVIAVKAPGLWDELVLNTQHEYRQILDVPDRPPNLDHFNYRINPHTAAQALIALDAIEAEIAHVRQEQRRLIDQLVSTEAIEPLPDDENIVFKPLTALPRYSEIDGWTLYDLPIPARLTMASKYDLPETYRQFRYRKLITPRFAEKFREGKSLKPDKQEVIDR
jgi:dTDP-4-amino-4,6-dideoxygalactose transaminase